MGIFHGSRDKSFTIRRPTADKWPVHMGAVNVVGSYEKKHLDYVGKAPDNLFFGKLVTWQCHFFEREKDKFVKGQWHNGDDSNSYWDRLRRWARKSGTVWLFGWKIWPAWCLLDGKREIDEQRLILDIRQDEDGNPSNKGRPRKPQGLFVAENPPTIICLAVPGGGRIKMIDLGNYGIEPEDTLIDPEKYQLHGAIIAIKEYYRLCKTYNLGSLQTTAASQSWYCYRRSHMTTPVVVHPMEKVLALEQAAYYGGRCECVRIGHWKKKLYHLDVNSMYTALGLVNAFPARYLSTWVDSDWGKPPMPSCQRLCIADVTLKTIHNRFPARESVKVDPCKVPGRKSGRERIIYPIGTYRTALAGVELDAAIDGGLVEQFHRIQYYETAMLMGSWSVWALEMRKTLADKGFSCMARCAKKIMNSLPGKWGQRQKKWVDYHTNWDGESWDPTVDLWSQEHGKHPVNGDLTSYRTMAGQTQYQDREELSAVACPAIAAFWTAAGRQYLWGAIVHCGVEHVYYYDTDSLIVDEEGYQRMATSGFVDSSEPGKWKVKEESDDVEILGIRRYRFGPRWCVAGPFGQPVVGSGTPGEFQEHEGFGAQLWHKSVGDAVEVKRRVRWSKDYRHGYVDKDGIVWPFFVGQPLPKLTDPIK